MTFPIGMMRDIPPNPDIQQPGRVDVAYALYGSHYLCGVDYGEPGGFDRQAAIVRLREMTAKQIIKNGVDDIDDIKWIPVEQFLKT